MKNCENVMVPSFEKFKEICKKMNGNLSKIAMAFGVERRTVYFWINDNIEFKNILDDTRETTYDAIEDNNFRIALGIPKRDDNGNIIDYIIPPSGDMSKFLSKTLMKQRGYVERVENLNMEVQTFGAIPDLKDLKENE